MDKINQFVKGFREFFNSNKELIESEYLAAPEQLREELDLNNFALEVFLELE